MTKPLCSPERAVQDLELGGSSVTYNADHFSGPLTVPDSKEDLLHLVAPHKSSSTPRVLFKYRSRPVKGSISDRKRSYLRLDAVRKDEHLGAISTSDDHFGSSYPISRAPRTFKSSRKSARLSASYPLFTRTPLKSRSPSGKRLPGLKLWVLGTSPSASPSFQPPSSPRLGSGLVDVGSPVYPAGCLPDNLSTQPTFGEEEDHTSTFEPGLQCWGSSSGIFSPEPDCDPITPSSDLQTLHVDNTLGQEIGYAPDISKSHCGVDLLYPGFYVEVTCPDQWLFNGHPKDTISPRDVPLGGAAFTHLDEDLMELYDGPPGDEAVRLRDPTRCDPDPSASSDFVTDEALDQLLLSLYERKEGESLHSPPDDALDATLLALYEGGDSMHKTSHYRTGPVCSCCSPGIALPEIAPDVWPFSYRPFTPPRYHLRLNKRPKRRSGI